MPESSLAPALPGPVPRSSAKEDDFQPPREKLHVKEEVHRVEKRQRPQDQDSVEGVSETQKSNRYKLPQAPPFTADVQVLIEHQEPAHFASQGKPRGRKPNPKAKAEAGSTNKRPGRKPKKVRRSKRGRASRKQALRKAAEKAVAAAATGASTAKPVAKPKAKSTASKRRRAETAEKEHGGYVPEAVPAGKTKSRRQSKSPAARVGEDVQAAQPVHSGPRRVPPPHVKWNNVYSSAYRRAQKHGAAYARAAGQMAAELFKKEGVVNDLCGDFRAPSVRVAEPRPSVK